MGDKGGALLLLLLLLQLLLVAQRPLHIAASQACQSVAKASGDWLLGAA